jgi:hypothetical protein
VSPSVGTGKGVQERDHQKGGERPSRGWNWGLEVAKLGGLVGARSGLRRPREDPGRGGKGGI